MRKSSGDPIYGGFLNDASAVGPVKGIRESSGYVPDCLRLWALLRLPSTKICKIFRPEGPRRKKIRNPFQHEGRQAKSDTRRTDYEGQSDIQWQLGVTPDTNRLDKTGGLGSPQRPFGYFSGEGKVPRRRHAPPAGLIKAPSAAPPAEKRPGQGERRRRRQRGRPGPPAQDFPPKAGKGAFLFPGFLLY